MSQVPSTNSSLLSSDALERIDQARHAYEAEWRDWQAGHPTPPLEPHVYETSDPDERATLLQDLRAVADEHQPVWYYTCHGADDEQGPVSLVQLRELAVRDLLKPYHRVRREGERQRIRACKALPRIYTVAGHELWGVLGEGGMGVVYEAWHPGLGRRVALKMIRDRADSPESAERFQMEARAVARLQHPNIVQIFESGEHDGELYVSLEYVDGASLAQRLSDYGLHSAPRSGRRQRLEAIARFVETLARATHHAHLRGLVHQDLKPANVLLTQDGVPKITDFGLARRLDPEVGGAAAEPIGGTAAYMAWEQAALYLSARRAADDAAARAEAYRLLQQIGPQTDVYALGAILYEMLLGRPPFALEDLPTGVGQPSLTRPERLVFLEVVRDQKPPSPRQLNSHLSRDLEAICLKCLEKGPAQRYADAEALADDLLRFRRGEPVQARPVGLPTRAWKWTRRRPAAAALSVVSVMALLGLIGGLVWANVTAEQHNRELTGEIERRTLAENDALEKKEIAEKEAGENLRRFIRMTLASSEQMMREGDLPGALLYAAEALTRDDKNHPQARMHSLRMALGLQQSPKLLQVWAHAQAVTFVGFSPDGGKILTASIDGTARIWDAHTGSPMPPQPLVHDAPINFAAFSPDGLRVVTGGDDKTVRLWESQSGKLLREPFQLRHAAFQVAFKPGDGKYVLAVSGDKYAGAFWRHSSPTTTTTPGTWVQGPPIQIPGPTRTIHIPGSVVMDRIPTGTGPGGVPQYTTIPRTLPGSTIQVPGPPIQIPGPMRYIPGTNHTTPGTSQQVQPFGMVHVWDVETGQAVDRFIRQKGWINSAAFSPDGTQVVTAGGSLEGKRAAMVWGLTAREEPEKGPQTRLGHAFDVYWAVFSPCGRRVLTASGPLDGTTGEARVWDVATGEPVGQTMKHGGPVTQAVFSPDGRRVLTASADETARVWNAETGEPTTHPLRHRDRLTGAWFSADGRRVLTASWDGTARVWDASTGGSLSPPLRHASRVTAAAFSPDGRRILTASHDGLVCLWDLAIDVYDLAFLRHPAVVQAPGPRRMELADARRTVQSKTYRGDVLATSAVFSSDSRLIVSGAGSRVLNLIPGGGQASATEELETHHLCVWDAATGKLVLRPLAHEHPVTATLVDPDGRRVLTVGDGGVRLWELPAGKLLAHCPPERNSRFLDAAFCPDGRCLLITTVPSKVPPAKVTAAASVVQVRDAVSNELVAPLLELDAPVERAVLSLDGSKLGTLALRQVSADRKDPKFEWVARAWDLKNEGRPTGPPLKPSNIVTQIAVSPNGERIITYRPSAPGASAAVVGVSESNQEREAQLWHVVTGRSFSLKHAGAITHAAFSPDGRHVVTASADRTARVWSAETGESVLPPLEHRARVNYASFSRDGLVVTASNDSTARIWDLATGEPVSPPLKHKNLVLHAAFSGDGRQLVTSDLDGTARVWNLVPDDRGDEYLKRLSQLLASYRLDAAGGLTALDRETFQRTWKELRERHAGAFAVSPRQVFNWHREEAADAEQAADWRAVLLHLNQLIAVEPADGLLRTRRGRTHALLGQWEEAAVDYAKAIELDGDNDALWHVLALIYLKQGKLDDYRRTCADLLRRFGQTKDPRVAGAVIRTCVLGPDAVADFRPLLRLGERVLAGKNPSQAAHLGLLGSLYYRAGQWDSALQKLREANKAPEGASTIEDGLFLAMIHHRLGKAEEARQCLDRAAQMLGPAAQEEDGEAGRNSARAWVERLEFQRWYREAEILINGAGDKSKK